ncbi:MAG: DedA family protein [Candidatus Magasanikbacteria bacterium]|nr:DedA family protein [Candidatus Magasanikbacteria bacterium]
MQFIKTFISFFSEIDSHLVVFVADFGAWIYGLLFLIIFCETGLVVTPFLPGDSLLFAAGAIAALGSLNIVWLFILLCLAAIIGDTVNYNIGRVLGPKVFSAENARFFKREYLEKAERFYEKHGKKTIIIARFIPIIRTFAPFVAGIGNMSYPQFIIYNIVGGIVWVGLFLGAGYIFGNVPIVKDNFTLVIMGIIGASLLPGLIEYIRHKRS